MEQNKIEKCLTPIRKDITYITRGRHFGTVEVRFREAEKAPELTSLKTKDVVFLLTYTG